MARTLNNKANAVVDTATIVAVVLIFIIVMVVGWMILSKTGTMMKLGITANSTADNILNLEMYKYPRIFDNIALFVFIGLFVIGIVASFMIDTHPIFFILTAIALVFVCIGAIYISNYYETFASSDGISSYAAAFVKTNFIMQHLLEEIIAMGFTIALVLYAKLR